MNKKETRNSTTNKDNNKVNHPTLGRSFLEKLLSESETDNESSADATDFTEVEIWGEMAIQVKGDKGKKLKYLRFPKLKEMLDGLTEEQPVTPDGYVILDQVQKKIQAADVEEIQNQIKDGRDDTSEFLNSISEKLKFFGKAAKEPRKSNRFEDDEDEDAFEQSIVKSITQDDSIVSETLADLLHAQGQFSKALKMYQALILKFPEKSAFFARKIEQIHKKYNR
jgi:hypothetical protein